MGSTVIEIVQYVDNKIIKGEKVTIYGLARRFGVSRRWIHVLFYQQFGLSPKEYISQKQFKYAQECYLEDNTLLIKQLHYKVGIRSRNNFSRLVKRYTQMAPRDYFTKGNKY